MQPGDIHQPRVGQRRGHREPDRLAAYAPATEPGPGGMVAPPAAGQLVHDLQATPGHGLERLNRHPGGGRRRAVPPAAVAVEHLADELTAATEAAQVEPEFGAAVLGARDGGRVRRGSRRLRDRVPQGLRDLRGWRDLRGSRGRAGGWHRFASHVRGDGHEPIPPSAGPGHRARVQCVGREFAGHQDAVIQEIRLEPDLRDRVPEHLPRNCGAGRIGWQRPRMTRSRVHAPQAADALLPHTWRLRLTRHKAVGRRGAVGSKSVINIRGFRLLICETQITTHRPHFAISLASLFSSQLYTDVPHRTEISFSDIRHKLPRTPLCILLTLLSCVDAC